MQAPPYFQGFHKPYKGCKMKNNKLGEGPPPLRMKLVLVDYPQSPQIHIIF